MLGVPETTLRLDDLPGLTELTELRTDAMVMVSVYCSDWAQIKVRKERGRGETRLQPHCPPMSPSNDVLKAWVTCCQPQDTHSSFQGL